MLSYISALDTQALAMILGITSGLLLILMVRIIFLLRTYNRLRESTGRMEKQVLVQHQEILAVRQDSNAWRGELQRMSDAFRSEYAKRMTESELRYDEIQKRRELVPALPAATRQTDPATTAAPIVADVTVQPVPAISGTGS